MATCDVHVKPRSRVERVTVSADEVLTVAVSVPAAENRANRRLLYLLAECLGVARTRIRIIRGTTSRHKVVAVDSMPQAEIVRRVKACMPRAGEECHE